MKIAIFKETLGQLTENYILDQVRFLKKYEPKLFCLYSKGPIQSLDHTIINPSKLEVILYKLFGINKNLKESIQKFKPDIIHIHGGCIASRFLRIQRQLNIPIVVSFHGSDATTTDRAKILSNNWGNIHYVLDRKKLIARTSKFIAVSNFIFDKLILQGIPEIKIVKHYIGIDTNKFKTTQIIHKKLKVLFVGRLELVKGCRYLMTAMHEIQKENSSIDFTIIGDGTQINPLKLLSKQLKLKVTFLGSQPQDKIIEHLRESSLLCVPSIKTHTGAEEALGLVFAEAQALGTPVVSFKTGGIPEVVLDKETGLLCDEKDVSSLCKNILKLLYEKETRETFSVRGIKHINNNFNIITQTEKLERIYDQVIHNKQVIQNT